MKRLGAIVRGRGSHCAPLLVAIVTAGVIHAAGPAVSTILSGGGMEYASAVTTDRQGNVYVAGLTYSPDFPVTAGAMQTTFGQTSDAFIAKIGADGKVIWSTYLGGILDDWITGIALDSAGNVLVTGWTRSPNFPLVNPVQSVMANFDAFVAKLDPNGTKLIYSTRLGGQGNDGAAGIAVDSAGNAYVAVSSSSAAGYPGTQNAPDQSGIFVSKLNPEGGLVFSYFHPGGTAAGIALDAATGIYVTGSSATGYTNGLASTMAGFLQSSGYKAIVFKLSPDGSKKIYETALGGSTQSTGAGIAVNSAGEAWVAGSTSSADFPLVKPLQTTTGAQPFWKSTNGGANWTATGDLPFAVPVVTVVDPTTPTTLYEGTGDLGVFKSVDGGTTWTTAGSGISGKNVQGLAIDPVHPQTLYASASSTQGNAPSSSAIYKTVNGGGNWSLVDSLGQAFPQMAVDAQNPNIVWEVGGKLRKSTDGGATWNDVAFPGPSVVYFALDPRVSGQLYATSSFIFCSFNCNGNATIPYLYRSVNGGATWTQLPVAASTSAPVLVDGSTNPSTVYNGLTFRSADNGNTWTAITAPPGNSPTLLAVDPAGALYASSSQGLFVSQDHAQTWTGVGSFSTSPLVPAGSTGTLYGSINQLASAAFVSKLSADGQTLAFSSYLRGHASLVSSSVYNTQPNVFTTQTWASAIVLDAAGNATVAGGTRSTDFPTANPAQSSNGGNVDGFLATIAADAAKLNSATYYGGSQDDGILAVTLDAQGDLVIAGQTFSPDFPKGGGSPLPFSYGDAFVTKLAPVVPPAITAVLNGASYQPGIEAGSWVMIRGSNLANTSRTWTSAETAGGKLPTSLDGVSVTINGKPAFVYYISSTQINVQAPSDAAVGPVDVVVSNNGAVSPPATAQLQAVAPAFFVYPGTSYTIASRLPDYALAGDPSAVPGVVAVKPGDYVVLWGTGFGATNPAVGAGAAVTGTPAVTTLPLVTVGGQQSPVASALLTVGSAGLYQVTIQIPANVPAGAVAVQASVGGSSTQSAAMLFIVKP